MAEDAGNVETTTPPAEPTTQPAPEAAPQQNTPQTPEQPAAPEEAPGPSLADVQSENEGLRAILGALNPDMDIDDELGYVGRGGKYRAPAAPAPEVDNRQSRRAPLQIAALRRQLR